MPTSLADYTLDFALEEIEIVNALHVARDYLKERATALSDTRAEAPLQAVVRAARADRATQMQALAGVMTYLHQSGVPRTDASASLARKILVAQRLDATSAGALAGEAPQA